MRIWGIVTIALSAMLAAPDSAAGGWYVHVYAGLNDADDSSFRIDAGTVRTSFDGGSLWGFAFGYELAVFRLEGEIDTSRTNDVDLHTLNGMRQSASTGEVESEAGMLNILFDFRRDTRVSPYVGAGLGLAEVELKGFGVAGLPGIINDEDNLLAYQIVAGVGIAVSQRWILDFDLRYYETVVSNNSADRFSGRIARLGPQGIAVECSAHSLGSADGRRPPALADSRRLLVWLDHPSTGCGDRLSA